MPASERAARGTTPAGFRARLLSKLRDRARDEKVGPKRLQDRVAFERLLARLDTDGGEWIVKGGFALELRYGWRHRPTRDIDLRTEASLAEALASLRRALVRGQESEQRDYFSFELGEPGPEMQGAPGGAWRIPVTARVAGDVFATFHIDLSSGDAVVQPPDTREGSDLLDYAGIPHIRVPIYPVTQHLAEKLHAYTLPRTKENTRTKDLVDLLVMTAVETIDGMELIKSVRATFGVRRSHEIPVSLPAPERSWALPFKRLATEAPAAPTTDLDEAFDRVRVFWGPVLEGTVEGVRWDPGSQRWGA
jgi:hypothetical protein